MIHQITQTSGPAPVLATLKYLPLSAEALVANGTEKPVAFVFGPENGAVSEKLVYEAAREAHAKSYSHLYVIGFAIQPNARTLADNCAAVVGVSATYLILETKGFDELEEVKRAAAERWVAAVNAEGSHGTWRYGVVKKVSDVGGVIGRTVADE